ncbi:hypothetical protein GCM10010403_40440 [Glycomyces rutgersensis]|uniref:Uncharacterized protein n=1 Tax=Glycomyces rutgersensis TaxID=58115 RepID=A0ABN3G3A7_9ACTN
MPFSLARCPVAAAAPEPVFRDPILVDPLHVPHQSERSGWPVAVGVLALIGFAAVSVPLGLL